MFKVLGNTLVWLPNLFPHPSCGSGANGEKNLFCENNRRRRVIGDSPLSCPHLFTWPEIAWDAFWPRHPSCRRRARGDLWTNMLRGKCKGTGRELLILGIMSEEEEMKKQWERQRLIKRGRRGQHCVQLRPLASSPVQDRPGSDGCSPAEKEWSTGGALIG